MTTPYYATTGKRKSAIANVRLHPHGKGNVQINGRSLQSYFYGELIGTAVAPLAITNLKSTFDVEAKVRGGGQRGQAEAIRLGISKALLLHNPDFRTTLKHAGFLKRDPRVKERKKPGLHRARRGHQYSKR